MDPAGYNHNPTTCARATRPLSFIPAGSTARGPHLARHRHGERDDRARRYAVQAIREGALPGARFADQWYREMLFEAPETLEEYRDLFRAAIGGAPGGGARRSSSAAGAVRRCATWRSSTSPAQGDARQCCAGSDESREARNILTTDPGPAVAALKLRKRWTALEAAAWRGATSQPQRHGSGIEVGRLAAHAATIRLWRLNSQRARRSH